ncbi:MAG TPA: SDR family oxidoreductase [SAR324 cluster bacterium]|nr:SDR family oxidoreductase [SAR324 cluster bacterium]
MSETIQNILVIGAKSDIAIAVAREYAEQSCSLQLAARETDSLKEFREDLRIRGASKVEVFKLDLESVKSIKSFLNQLDPLPDLAVCAVGYLGEQSRSEKDFEEMEKVVKSNLTGPAMILESLAQAMMERKTGVIVGISSVAGDRGRASNYWYGCAKSGLTAFLSGLRQRIQNSGVRVLTVKPGFVRTAMTANLNLPPALTSTPEKTASDIVKAVSKNQPVLYTPFFWFWIMLIIRGLPEKIFLKLKNL